MNRIRLILAPVKIIVALACIALGIMWVEYAPELRATDGTGYGIRKFPPGELGYIERERLGYGTGYGTGVKPPPHPPFFCNWNWLGNRLRNWLCTSRN